MSFAKGFICGAVLGIAGTLVASVLLEDADCIGDSDPSEEISEKEEDSESEDVSEDN